VNRFDTEKLRKQLDALNNVVGTSLVDKYKREIHLPQGYHLDFGLHSKKFYIVDRYGACVFI